jgi:L-tartrate/succinate antiporter
MSATQPSTQAEATSAGRARLAPSPWRAAVPLLAGAIVALVPAPSGLPPRAWYYFAAFAAVIVGLVLEPIPAAAVGLFGVTFLAAVGLPFSAAELGNPAFKLPAEAVKWALAGFANSTVWLIFGAFMFAMGYEKTGLGRRIALVLVRSLGGRTLGLGYAIALADLVLAPFTPSNSARSAGTIYPVIRSIPGLYGSQPGATARRMGAYLMWVAFAVTCVTSSMFVTALAPNLLALELVKRATGVEFTWTQWCIGFLPVGAGLVLVLPWLIFRIYPPEIRTSADVPRWASEELARLGRISSNELIMAALAVLALGLWIFGGKVIDPALVALVGVCLMLACGLVTWDDILGNRPAWNMLTWFATLVVLADGLNKVGFVGWFARSGAALLGGVPPVVVLVVLVSLFFFVHYMFASLTAHATAVLPVMLAAGAAVPGLPVAPFALLLVYSLGLMGVITPYATGPAPVYFGSGYLSRKDFWRLGLTFGLIYLATLLGVGLPYLRLIGIS